MSIGPSPNFTLLCTPSIKRRSYYRSTSIPWCFSQSSLVEIFIHPGDLIMYRNNLEYIPSYTAESSHTDIVIQCSMDCDVYIINITKAEECVGVIEIRP